MRAAQWPRSLGMPSRMSNRRYARAGRVGHEDPSLAVKPRCLGELRLADQLRAGLIDVDEFKSQRAALLARL
jgi:hypothetical protein